MDPFRGDPDRPAGAEHVPLPPSLLGLAFEAAPNGLLVVDGQARIVAGNAALLRMFGYEAAELIGQPLELLVPQPLRDAHRALRIAYLAAPERRAMGSGRELHARDARGREFPVEIGLNPMRTPHGTMVLASIIDISVRRRMELDLKRANENLREFVHVASHDLKSPLRGIADLVNWVLEDLGGEVPAPVQHNLARIGDRVTRMERLISDLLRYARSEHADVELDLIDFRELVSDILRVDPLPPGLVLEVQVEAPPLLAPRTPVETVLRNLIGNAAKHHDRSDGCIGVTVCNDRGYCRICVADDGPGIPAAAQERVFRIFQTATHAPNPGSGLGLALAKRLVEVHGGRIELHSPRNGQRGAEFRVWWPRHSGSTKQ